MIAFIVELLNEFNILAGDIQNMYLITENKEKKSCLYAGYEWKYNQRKVLVIVQDLYGLKPSASAWNDNYAEVLGNHMDYKYLPANNDVWIKASTEKDGNHSYTYILVYVYDIVIV